MSEYCAMCTRKLNGDESLMTFEALGPRARKGYTRETYVICRFCALSISAFVEGLADLRDSMDEFYRTPVCEDEVE